MTLTDRREIEFDSDAVVYCIAVSLRAAQGFGLPAMTPVEVRFFPKDNVVDVLYNNKDGRGAVRISAEALGAVLVSYCIRAKIPMPRIADKAVRVESNCIILAFRSQFEKAPAPVMADTSSRAAEPVKSWKWIDPVTLGGRNP